MLNDLLTPTGSASLGLRHSKSVNDLRNGNESQAEGNHGILSGTLRWLFTAPRATSKSTPSWSGHRLPDGTLDSSNTPDYRTQILDIKLTQAQSYTDWLAAAIELDEVEGKDVWKQEEESSEYDTALVRARLQQMDETRLSRDQSRILLLVRTGLTRNLGGMGDLRLYKHCRVGTKALIERYIESALETIDTLVDMSSSPAKGKMDPQRVLNELVFTRQSFGRSALLLSGGGTFGMNHIGVTKALYEAQLLPRIISGASAGSIVCAVLCTKTDAEIPGVLEEFCYGDLAVFDKPGEEVNILRKAFHFVTKGALFDISNLVRVMKDLLGDITFAEAYNRTRRILNICVSTASLYELPRLLNYITAPNVMIWSAVAASCSVPFIYSAAQLFAKDPRTGEQVPWNQSPQRWIDGSVDNDLPMTRLSEMFNVNHFIVSQVNPHVVPFLERDEDHVAAEAQQSNATSAAGPGWLRTMTNLAKSETLHRMQMLTEMGILPNAISKVRSVLGQRYSGDITIFPRISYANFPKVLTNPTTDFMIQAMLSGEQATWPKLSEIKNHCAIELALDDAVHQMMAQVAFSPSQVDLRRLNALDRSTFSGQSDQGQRNHSRRRSHQPHKSNVEAPRLHVPVRKSVAFGQNTLHTSPPTTLKISGGDSTSETESDTECSESEDGSSSSGSAEDPYASPQLNLWPSTRQLFPSISQPVTPSTYTKAPFGTSPTSTTNSLSMTITTTPTTKFSNPELQYKNLFHDVKSGNRLSFYGDASPKDTRKWSVASSNPGAEDRLEEDDEEAFRRPSRSSLDLDISGTKGMMRRRKRSLSTGLKSSWSSPNH